MIDHAYLIANGDQRLSANRTCWPAQQRFEAMLTKAFHERGVTLERAHPADTPAGHGFIASQAQGLAVLASVPAEAPLVVAEGVWQFSQQVLGGLLRHRGPILTVANWEGQWPGLVGLLNLNASLVKAGRPYQHSVEPHLHRRVVRQSARQLAAGRHHRPRHQPRAAVRRSGGQRSGPARGRGGHVPAAPRGRHPRRLR